MLPESLKASLQSHLMSVYALQGDACSSASSRHPQARKVSHIAPFFSAHLLERGYAIRTIQELLGHSDENHDSLYPRTRSWSGWGKQPCRPSLFLASAKVQVCRETVAKFGVLCGPSIMLGRNDPILERPCRAIDLRHR